MNNRLVSRVKALNYTVDNFPVFTEENPQRYLNLKFELTSSLMRRDIIKVAKKCTNRPKHNKKLLDMWSIYSELIDSKNTATIKFNGVPLDRHISAKAREFLDYIDKYIKLNPDGGNINEL